MSSDSETDGPLRSSTTGHLGWICCAVAMKVTLFWTLLYRHVAELFRNVSHSYVYSSSVAWSTWSSIAFGSPRVMHQQGLLLRGRRGHRGSPAEPAIAADDVLSDVAAVLGDDLSCVRIHGENPVGLRWEGSRWPPLLSVFCRGCGLFLLTEHVLCLMLLVGCPFSAEDRDWASCP